MKIHCNLQSSISVSVTAVCHYQVFPDKMCVWNIFLIHGGFFMCTEEKKPNTSPALRAVDM